MRIVNFTARLVFRAIHLSVCHLKAACAAILRGVKTCRFFNAILILKSALDGWRLANVIEPTGSRLAHRSGIALLATFPTVVRIIVDIRAHGFPADFTKLAVMRHIAVTIGFILARYDIRFTLALLANAGARFDLGAIRLAIPAMLRVILKIPAPALAFILRTTVELLACAIAAIFIGITRRFAIPAMLRVIHKIPAPTLAFILCT